MRMTVLAGLLLLALAAIARAGTVAEVEIIGFSENGEIFAFEEYGIQDGSGFPFANRFYVETASDSFVSGTPIRVRIDDEAATLEEARRRAQERGEAVISDAELTANRGYMAGWNAVTEFSADPTRMAVNPRPIFPAADAPLEFRLEEIALSQPERCRDLGDVVGFRLVRAGIEPGQTAEIVHEDRNVPESRGCPLGYRIGGVQTFFPDEGAPVFAVMIAIRSFGFEGPDYRWIAVTGRL